MPSVKRHPLVRADLQAAVEWYEAQVPGLGRRFNAEAIALLKRLPSEALLYAVRFHDLRRVNLPSFPHGVFYFLDGEQVVVLGVLHGARDSEAALAARRESFG